MAKSYKVKAAPQQAVLPKVNAMKHMADTNVTVANNHSNEYPGVKTSGIKIRGTGAATKGVMARGPMA
ncbi:MAG: hypothetical protein ACK4Y5_15310 [Acetobacteraceae bacterium]|jgi:hypothetical protein